MALIKKQTLQGTFYSYLSAGIGLITQGYLIPNYFSTDQNGLISILLMGAMLLPLLANFGFNGAGTMFFPYFRDKPTTNHGYLFLALAVSLVGFCITVLLLFVFKQVIINDYEQKSKLFVTYYYYLIPLVASMLIFNVFDVYARLHYDSVTGTFLSQFLLRFNNLLATLLYVFGWIDFRQFMIIWTIGFSVPTFIIIAKAIREDTFSLRPDFGFLRQSKLLLPMLKFCSFSVVASMSSQVVLYIDKIMITDLLDLSAVGVYSTAALFGTVIAMPMVVMQKIAGTIVADAWKNNDRATIAKIYRKSCLIQLFAGFWVFLGVCANLHNIFQFIPNDYEAGKMVIVWIGISKVIDMAMGINSTILNTSKYYYADTIFFIIISFATVGLNVWLIPSFGIVGAAVGASIAVFMFNLFRYLLLFYLFGFQPFNYKNILLILFGIGCFLVVTQLPILTGSKLLVILDMLYRSLILTAIFVGGFFVSKFSEEFNNQCLTIYNRLKKALTTVF